MRCFTGGGRRDHILATQQTADAGHPKGNGQRERYAKNSY